MPKRSRLIVLGVLLSMFVISVLHIQAQSQHLPRGTAVVLPHDDLLAIKQKSADKPVNDTQVAVVPINNDEYRLAVGIAHRSKASVDTPGGGAVESTVTSPRFIKHHFGQRDSQYGRHRKGSERSLKPGAPNGPSGPTASGGEIIGGVSKAVGPGDVVVIPPNTPHRFSAINTDEIVYVLVRPDPHKVLPVMNLLAK